MPSTGFENEVCELGKLYYERCDFTKAIAKYKASAEVYLREKNFSAYLECQNCLLRMYAEREDKEQIQVLKENLQNLAIREGFELNARTFHTLGICASYKGQYDVAIDYFQKSLSLALLADNKEHICLAISGLAIMYYNLDRLDDALKEIRNLDVFFEVMPMTDVKVSVQMLRAHILRKQKKHEQAIEVLWQSYDSLKLVNNLFMYLCLLYGIGFAYKEAGHLDLARMHLQLVKRSINPNDLKLLSKQVEAQLKDLGVNEDFDLIFDSSNHSVVERHMGRVDFRNQIVLLDVLRLFMKNPGTPYSKESLVREVWKQNYDPTVHDNKIYVTIKRLRKLIEPDFDKPKYIFRAKNGYYLNKTTKVQLNH